jgi:hypothetical protein
MCRDFDSLEVLTVEKDTSQSGAAGSYNHDALERLELCFGGLGALQHLRADSCEEFYARTGTHIL